MATTQWTYEEWDEERRVDFPTAKHVMWDSYLGRDIVAKWNPNTGRSWIDNEPDFDPENIYNLPGVRQSIEEDRK